jgi:hypothetical protein
MIISTPIIRSFTPALVTPRSWERTSTPHRVLLTDRQCGSHSFAGVSGRQSDIDDDRIGRILGYPYQQFIGCPAAPSHFDARIGQQARNTSRSSTLSSAMATRTAAPRVLECPSLQDSRCAVGHSRPRRGRRGHVVPIRVRSPRPQCRHR